MTTTRDRVALERQRMLDEQAESLLATMSERDWPLIDEPDDVLRAALRLAARTADEDLEAADAITEIAYELGRRSGNPLTDAEMAAIEWAVRQVRTDELTEAAPRQAETLCEAMLRLKAEKDRRRAERERARGLRVKPEVPAAAAVAESASGDVDPTVREHAEPVPDALPPASGANPARGWPREPRDGQRGEAEARAGREADEARERARQARLAAQGATGEEGRALVVTVESDDGERIRYARLGDSDTWRASTAHGNGTFRTPEVLAEVAGALLAGKGEGREL